MRVEGSLTLAEIERILKDEREDAQRKVNQGVLKNDLNQSIQALGAMDALERALYSLAAAIRRDEESKNASRAVVDRMYTVSPIRRKKAGGA